MIKLKKILDDIHIFFIDKLQKDRISFEVNCKEGLVFESDALFIQFILMSLIGTCVYRVPKDGKISILSREENGDVASEIKDNGYIVPPPIKKQMGKPFELLIPEDVLESVCQSNGLVYEKSKTEDGLNRTKLITPTKPAATIPDNVISLFK